MTQQTPLACALDRIDTANRADPNIEQVGGIPLPKEYAYSQHMTRWLFELEPQPSERMQIACRAQHIERWTIPRSDFPEGRKAYYEWRQACGRMHGRRAAAEGWNGPNPVEGGREQKALLARRLVGPAAH